MPPDRFADLAVEGLGKIHRNHAGSNEGGRDRSRSGGCVLVGGVRGLDAHRSAGDSQVVGTAIGIPSAQSGTAVVNISGVTQASKSGTPSQAPPRAIAMTA